MSSVVNFTKNVMLHKQERLLWGLAGCIALVQLFFYVYPIEVRWYWPVLLFYMRLGAGLIGVASLLILAAFGTESFSDRHVLAWRAGLMVTIGYALTGFGTEYVAVINKAQLPVDQADRIVTLIAALYAVLATLKNLPAWAARAIRIASIIAISNICYVIFSPATYPQLPILSTNLNTALYIFTVLAWLLAGMRFWSYGKEENSIWDFGLGGAFILCSAFTGNHFFEVWHPLWMVYSIGGSFGYLVAALLISRMIQTKNEFHLKSYFAFSLFTLLVPLVTLASGVAGVAAWRFSARSIESQMVSFGYHLQTLYAHENLVLDSDTHKSDSIYVTNTIESLDITLLPESPQIERLQYLAERTSYAQPIGEVYRIKTPGQIPEYHLMGIVPLAPETTIFAPVTIIEQALPVMVHDVARVRLWTMIAVVGASVGLFAVLWRIITSADRQINEQKSQLNNTLRELRIAEQGREELTSMIVHDLRSPLSAIVSSLQLLDRMSKTGDLRQQRTLRRAITASNSMRTMITDILNISKMERGQLELEYSDIYIQDFIGELSGNYESLALKDGNFIRQKLDITTASPKFSADEQLIRRVFDNLITNALRYTTKGGTITLGVETRAKEICFYVQDTGIGIPAEQLPYIFEKFTQVSTDTGQRRKGIGLGLAFCKLAVETHEGKIWVESVQGEGSTFFFSLPLIAMQTKPLAESVQAEIDNMVIVVGSDVTTSKLPAVAE